MIAGAGQDSLFPHLDPQPPKADRSPVGRRRRRLPPAPAQPVRFVSYGGGVQSTALLVLAGLGMIDFRTFVMANVGDDSEMPDTLTYVRHIAAPYAAEHGIDLHLVDRRRRDGSVETLLGRLIKPGSRSLPIPVRMSGGAPGQRSCTADFKIRVIGKWAKQRGASAEYPAVVGLGISLDEVERVNSRRPEPHERTVYPLLSWGEDTGLRMTRADCAELIKLQPLSEAHSAALRLLNPAIFGAQVARQLVRSDYSTLPVPGKSSCWFCPFHRPSTWDEMARTAPELFDQAADLEALLNRRRDRLGKDHVFLTRFGKPLRMVASDSQGLLLSGDDADNCDSGFCHT